MAVAPQVGKPRRAAAREGVRLSARDRSATEEFLLTATERFKRAADAERKLRQEALDDLKFSVGEQWDDQVRTQRELDHRPCLTMNRLSQFIRQVTNDQREQRPSPTVVPVGDGADVKTAKIFEGIIRHVQNQSTADTVYDYEFEYMVRCGFGAWRVVSEYAESGSPSLDQELYIRRIVNPFMVYYDPACVELDRSDANWCFIFADMTRKEFEAEYGKDRRASLVDFSTVGDRAPGWISRDHVRVAEYYYAVREERRYARLADGRLVAEDDAPEGAEVAGRVTKTARRLRWAKITAMDVLEEREVAGRYIPVVFLSGDELEVNGELHRAGLVRDAKDPQRAYNYWQTSAAEMIALAPKAPWVAAEGQLEGHEEQWRLSNRLNYAYLLYKPATVAGQPMPPPQRNAVEPPIAAMGAMIKLADNDLKATTGLYDASLGAPGPDQSGKAILLRQRQGNLATFNFSDNLARAIRFTGRILVDLIPKIYDTPRMQRIIRPDGAVEHVGVFNSQNVEGPAPTDPEEMAAEQKFYDLGVGTYDVEVTVGPSYQTKRQEAVASQMALIQAYPEAIKIIGDLVVKNMDWPEAPAIAERLKKLLPPNLLDSMDGAAGPEAQLHQMRAQFQLLAAQHDALTKALASATEIIKTKRLELESRERIAAMGAAAGIIEADVKAKSAGALQVLETGLETIQQRLLQLHANVPIDAEVAAAASAPTGGGAGADGAAMPGAAPSSVPLAPASPPPGGAPAGPAAPIGPPVG